MYKLIEAGLQGWFCGVRLGFVDGAPDCINFPGSIPTGHIFPKHYRRLSAEFKFGKKGSPIWNMKTSVCQKRYGSLYDWTLERKICESVLKNWILWRDIERSWRPFSEFFFSRLSKKNPKNVGPPLRANKQIRRRRRIWTQKVICPKQMKIPREETALG